MNQADYHQKVCTGKFDESGSLYYYDWKGFHPYTGIFYTIILAAVFLMVCVKIGSYQIKQNEPVGFIQPPKNMESIWLNFTLMVLIMMSFLLNDVGWKKYGYIFLILTKTVTTYMIFESVL